MAKRWVLSEPTRQRLQSTLNPHVPRTLRVGWWEQRQERGPPVAPFASPGSGRTPRGWTPEQVGPGRHQNPGGPRCPRHPNGCAPPERSAGQGCRGSLPIQGSCAGSWGTLHFRKLQEGT